jgi:hypothetical protein
MAGHRIDRACGRQLKGTIYAEKMGIEVHALQSAHRPVMVQDKTIFFYAGNQLGLAAAHIAEYHRPIKPDKGGLIQPVYKACLERYSCAQEGIADQPCGGDPVCIVMRDHPHAVTLQY